MEVEITGSIPASSNVNGVSKTDGSMQEEVQIDLKKEDKRLGLIEEVSDANGDDLIEVEKITKERAKKL